MITAPILGMAIAIITVATNHTVTMAQRRSYGSCGEMFEVSMPHTGIYRNHTDVALVAKTDDRNYSEDIGPMVRAGFDWTWDMITEEVLDYYEGNYVDYDENSES